MARRIAVRNPNALVNPAYDCQTVAYAAVIRAEPVPRPSLDWVKRPPRGRFSFPMPPAGRKPSALFSLSPPRDSSALSRSILPPAMPRLPGAKQKRQICCNLSFLSHGIYKAACAAVGGLFFMAVSYRAFVAAVCPCYEPSLRRFGVCLRFLRRHGLHAAQAVVFDGPLHALLAAQDQPPAILPAAAPLAGRRLHRHA